MPEPVDRMTKLREMLERQPGDTFLLYAIALEHKKAGDTASAIEYLDRTIQFDAGHAYAYFQKGQIFEVAGDVDAARQAYQAGVAAAQTKGDAHALSELQGALQMLD